MSDLISRDALWEEIQRYLDRYGRGDTASVFGLLEDVTDILAAAPAVDAVPVVHAKWKRHDEDWRHQYAGNECSACGFVLYGPVGHYCPRCGAKMDGGVKDGEG